MQERQNTCDAVRELVAWYPTGELTMEQRSQVEEHAAACPACAERLRFARSLAAAAPTCAEIHPEPDMLVTFVENAQELPAQERARIQEHLGICRQCAREAEILRGLEERAGVLERMWNALAASVLRPLPAAGYLALATAAVVLWVIRVGGPGPETRAPESGPPASTPAAPAASGTSARSFAGGVLLLPGETGAQRGEPQPGAEVPTWDSARAQLLLVEFTDLETPPAPGDVFRVRVSDAASGAVVWETAVAAEAFVENYTIGLMLAPGTLPPGRHQVSVRGPDEREIFRSTLMVR